MAALKLLFLCSLLFVVHVTVTGSLPTVQRSTANDNRGELAIDGEVGTCAMTGYEIGSWWKVDLQEPRLVSALVINGSADAIQVRVGNHSDPYASGKECERNPVCVYAPRLQSGNDTQLPCDKSHVGRYVSIHVVDPARLSRLELCEVSIQ